MGRILAIDYGSSRMGIALSDETETIAFPRPFINTGDKKKLLQLMGENMVEKVVLGLPLNLSGEEAVAAGIVREFGKWLEDQTSVTVEYVDERFSTKEALKEERNRILVDSVVAAKMLQRYLDNS